MAKNGVGRGTKAKTDRQSGELSQHCATPFSQQPKGTGTPSAPLIVAILAKTHSLSFIRRLDWRPMPPVRLRSHSVNRPSFRQIDSQNSNAGEEAGVDALTRDTITCTCCRFPTPISGRGAAPSYRAKHRLAATVKRRAPTMISRRPPSSPRYNPAQAARSSRR